MGYPFWEELVQQHYSLCKKNYFCIPRYEIELQRICDVFHTYQSITLFFHKQNPPVCNPYRWFGVIVAVVIL